MCSPYSGFSQSPPTRLHIFKMSVIFFFYLYLSYLFWFSVFRKHNIHTVTGRRLYMKLYTSTKACSEKEQEETKAVPSVRLKENMSVCVCAFSLGRKGAIAQKQTTNRDGGKGVWSVLEISLFTETSWQKAFFFQFSFKASFFFFFFKFLLCLIV